MQTALSKARLGLSAQAICTAYIDVACFGGMTLDKLTGISLLQYMQLCLTITKTVGQYHNAGYLCLDLKPENIFVMQNSPDDTITQLVEFIDFDSIKKINELKEPGMFSYTRLWAAPEQLDAYGASKIGVQTDIFTLGEIVFFLLFGKHSTDSEHRGFSKYPFDKCKKEYKLFTERPEVQNLFTRLFRGTLRSSPSNRFKSTQELARCDTIERYHKLSQANFNLVINPEARYAAQDMASSTTTVRMPVLRSISRSIP